MYKKITKNFFSFRKIIYLKFVEVIARAIENWMFRLLSSKYFNFITN